MKQFLINALLTVLMFFGMIACISHHSLAPRTIASIYTDLHGGAR